MFCLCRGCTYVENSATTRNVSHIVIQGPFWNHNSTSSSPFCKLICKIGNLRFFNNMRNLLLSIGHINSSFVYIFHTLLLFFWTVGISSYFLILLLRFCGLIYLYFKHAFSFLYIFVQLKCRLPIFSWNLLLTGILLSRP